MNTNGNSFWRLQGQMYEAVSFDHKDILGLYLFDLSLEAKKRGYISLKVKAGQNSSSSMFMQHFYSRFSQNVRP